jgi:uncharacterized iron-regulated membrane protein
MSMAPPTPPRRRRRAPLPRIARSTALARTAVIGLVMVALIFSGLTWQMIRGGDPALGSSGSSKTSTTDASTSTAAQTVTPPTEAQEAPVVVPQAPVVQQSIPAPTPVQSTPS